jgi:hypothetical protein
LAYNMYPAALPLPIAGGGSSGFFDFAQFAAGELAPPDALGRVNMFLRVVQIGGGANPSLTLRHTEGLDVTTVPLTIGSSSTFFFPGAGGSGVVTTAAILGQPVYRFQLGIPQDKIGDGTWSLQITNNNGDQRLYTWIVATSQAQSQQPWLFIAGGAGDFFARNDCQVLVNDMDQVDMELHNYGTAAINFNGGGADVVLGGFTVQSVPTTIPIGSSDSVTVQFNAPAGPGISSETWPVDYVHSPPAGAPGSATLQDSVELSAQHAAVEVVYVADASGSMAYTPEGTIPGAGESPRWQFMVDAVGNLMSELVGFASGAGKARVLMFPDISGITPAGPPADALTQRLIFDGDITPTLSADVDAALAAFNPLPGKAGTAIIEAVVAAMDNHFDNDPDAIARNRRTLVLMTDGSNTHGRPLSTLLPGGSHAGLLAARNINVVGVAYGRDDVTSPFHVDHALVADIAAQTADGATLIASDETTTSLNQAFTKAAASGLCVTVVIDPAGVLTDKAPHAYHGVCIGRHDRRVSFVVNWARNAEQPTIELRRPDGVIITEKDAEQDAYIIYDRGKHRKTITLLPKYLHKANKSNSAYGCWALHVFVGEKSRPPIPYEWGVLADTGARLKIRLDDETVFAGQPIDVSATFTVNGRPVDNAAITLRATVPTESRVNMLALAEVPEDAKKRAKEELKGEDVTGIDIKARAAVIGKVEFPPIKDTQRVITVPFKDTGEGVYRATLPSTAVQGRYELAIVGLADVNGDCVRREHASSVKVIPRPEPELSVLTFDTVRDKDIAVTTISVTPRDRFGNLVLVDPAANDFVAITSDDRKLKFRTPLYTDFDGTYRRQVEHHPDEPPRIDVRVGEVLLFDDVRVPADSKLSWMERVVQFDRGKDYKGTNKHPNPEHALGSAYQKAKDEFLSLGGGGAVLLGTKEQIFRAKEFMVFVHPDEPRRAYQIDVLAGADDRKPAWITLGKSKGESERFPMPPLSAPEPTGTPVLTKPGLTVPLKESLASRLSTIARPVAVVQPTPVAVLRPRPAIDDLLTRLPSTVKGWSVHAVRIIDLSNEIYGPTGKPSDTPGVSVRGIGYVPW